MTRVFPSKISVILFLILAGGFVSLFVVFFFQEASLQVIPVSIFWIAIFGFIFDIFLRTRYVIEDDKLIIKSGMINSPPIKINAIKSIRKTRSIIAAPASSLDRIEVTYNKYDYLIISPRDKSDFIHALQQINPTIEVQ